MWGGYAHTRASTGVLIFLSLVAFLFPLLPYTVVLFYASSRKTGVFAIMPRSSYNHHFMIGVSCCCCSCCCCRCLPVCRVLCVCLANRFLDVGLVCIGHLRVCARHLAEGGVDVMLQVLLTISLSC